MSQRSDTPSILRFVGGLISLESVMTFPILVIL